MKYKSVNCFPFSVLSRQAQIENSSLLHFYLAKSAFKLLAWHFSLFSFTILFIFLFFACTALLVKLLCILALH